MYHMGNSGLKYFEKWLKFPCLVFISQKKILQGFPFLVSSFCPISLKHLVARVATIKDIDLVHSNLVQFLYALHIWNCGHVIMS